MPWDIVVIMQCRKSAAYLDLMEENEQHVWRAERTWRAVTEEEVMKRRLLLFWRQERER
jgi:hypothetical protein